MKMLIDVDVLANEQHFNHDDFKSYIEKNNIPFQRRGLWKEWYLDVKEVDIDALIQDYKIIVKAKEAEKEEANRKTEEIEAVRRKAMSDMLITSGFSFEGYKIIKYSGYISGDDAISINRGVSGIFKDPTNVGQSLTDSLVKIRRQAIKELKEAAYDLGCNAVIGVDFDYITLEPETANSSGGTTYLPYVFCVTANGNAVVIEKIEE